MSLSDTQSICIVSNADGGSPLIFGWPRQVALRSSTKSHIALAKRGVYILGTGRSAVGGTCSSVFVWILSVFWQSHPTTTKALPALRKIAWTNPRPNESLRFVFNTMVGVQIEWNIFWKKLFLVRAWRQTRYMLCSPLAVTTSEFTGVNSIAIEVPKILLQTMS